MLFDPVLNSAIETEGIVISHDSFLQPLFCSHCNKPIRDRYYQSGNDYYDEYCWKFRYIIDPLFIERSSRKKVKELDDD